MGNLTKISILLILSSALLVSACDFLENGENGSDNGLTRAEAAEIAENAIRRSYQYVQYEGEDLRQTSIGRGIEGQYIFSFEFYIDTYLLPERIKGYSVEVEVMPDKAEIITVEEITG